MMSLDWMIELVARAEGISEADLKTIEDAIPAAQDLLGIVKEAMPLVTKALPSIQKVQPAAAIILAAIQKRTAAPVGSGPGTQAGGATGV
jgi:hypothetical protein